MEISAATLSSITDKVIPLVKEWQSRPLEPVYPFVWLDCMHYKVKDEGKVVARAVYNILALNREGRKDLIGMYVSESEGAGPEIKSHFRSILVTGAHRLEEPRLAGHPDCLH